VAIHPLFALDQTLDYPDITFHLRIVGHGEQVPDGRRQALSESVDPSVALLELDVRPRNVEVEHPVAVEVEVDPFARYIGGEENSYWRILLAERINDGVLVDVGKAGMEDRGLVFAQAETAAQLLSEPIERADPLGKDDDSF